MQHSAILRIVDQANRPAGCGIPTAERITCAAAAHKEPIALVGMPADASPYMEMGWGGAELTVDSSLLIGIGGGRTRVRDTALLIGIDAVP